MPPQNLVVYLVFGCSLHIIFPFLPISSRFFFVSVPFSLFILTFLLYLFVCLFVCIVRVRKCFVSMRAYKCVFVCLRSIYELHRLFQFLFIVGGTFPYTQREWKQIWYLYFFFGCYCHCLGMNDAIVNHAFGIGSSPCTSRHTMMSTHGKKREKNINGNRSYLRHTHTHT